MNTTAGRRDAEAPALAIFGAMHEELHALLPLVDDPVVETIGGRAFHRGTIGGRPVVLALSGIGKVAAAATTASLLARFEVDALLFTGVAGGLAKGVAVGDIVVADALMQHDLDASPLFPRYEVPLTGRARFPVDAARVARLEAAARRVLAGLRVAAPPAVPPAVRTGLVVSGDRFVATAAESAALRAALPDALAVEMEGAAVAQVAAAFGVPCAVVRTISDRADDLAHVDFSKFIAEVAAGFSRAIVLEWLADPC